MKYLLYCLLLVTEVVLANPSINERETTYPIYGSTVQELRQQMDQHGPRDQMTQYNASTTWYVKWNYKLDETSTSCRMAKTDIQVDILYYFPEWKNYPAAQPVLRNKWDLTMQQLRAHEREHGNNGKRAGVAIKNTLSQLPAMSNCQLLQSQVNKSTSRIIQHYHHADIELDARTAHGVVS